MKKALLMSRILFGALLLFASISFFLQSGETPELSGPMATFMAGILASQYLLPLAKVVELICGIAFVSGFYVPLATVVIFPITVNIVLIHVFLEPNGLPMAAAVLAANLFLAYAHRDRYKGLLEK